MQDQKFALQPSAACLGLAQCCMRLTIDDSVSCQWRCATQTCLSSPPGTIMSSAFRVSLARTQGDCLPAMAHHSRMMKIIMAT